MQGGFLGSWVNSGETASPLAGEVGAEAARRTWVLGAFEDEAHGLRGQKSGVRERRKCGIT